MKIKTTELIGLPLNWAVSDIEGWGEFDENGIPIIQLDSSHMRSRFGLWSPSTMWEHGGPIIEREEITIKHVLPTMKDSRWQAFPSQSAKGAGGKWGIGPTPLIAAMRCYVASKLGDEVEVPDEFVELQREEDERLARIKAEGEGVMKPYTVVLLRPDYIANSSNDAVVIEHCKSASPANAALVAMCDRAEQDDVAECGGSAADYVVIAVYEGHLESLL